MVQKNLSKSLLVFGALVLASSAYADNSSGYYLGAQAGYGKADYGSDFKKFTHDPNYFSSASSSEGNLAGRVFGGYQFNPYFAMETGFTLFSNNEYKGSGVDPWGNAYSTGFKLETWTWDVVGKAILPFSTFTKAPNPLSVFAEAGTALVNAHADVNDTTGTFSSGTSRQWKPLLGAGASYRFNPNLSVDVNYQHIFGEKTSFYNDPEVKLQVPSADFVGIGLAYHFA